MRNILSVWLVVLCFVVGCSDEAIKGNGKRASKSLALSSFHQLFVKGPIDVSLTLGLQPSGTLEADSNIINYIEVKNNNGLLILRVKNGSTIENTLPIKVQLVATQMQYVKKIGAGSFKVAGLESGRFQIHSEGSGLSQLSGQVDTLVIKRIGTGDVNARHLIARDSDVTNIGSGNIYLGDIEDLMVQINGTGNVYHIETTQVSKTKFQGSGKLVSVSSDPQ